MQCEFVNVTTADGLDLQGLVFVPLRQGSAGQTPTTVGVWIHGLTASFHSNHKRITTLAKVFNEEGIAFAAFDNRGHDAVAFARRYDKRKPKGYKSITIGAAFEKFTDCIYDLDAIVDFLRTRYKNVILIGHSTGANKVVYYITRPGKGKKVCGVVLASPVSDVGLYKKELGKNYEGALAAARDMIRNGEGNKLMPQAWSKHIRTARRFLSLADQNSLEQMFPTRVFRGPLTLFSKVKTSTLITFGENDSYLTEDKITAQEALGVFTRYHKSKQFKTLIIAETDHGYSEREEEFAEKLVSWIHSLRQMV